MPAAPTSRIVRNAARSGLCISLLAGLCPIAAGQTRSSGARVTPRAAGGDPGVIVVSGTPSPARPIVFTASPNPLTLTSGAVLGKTTLTWNAPAHKQLVIRVDEKKFADGLGSSGSLDTGAWVVDGMVFALIDPVIGQTLASVTMKVITPPPPGPVTFTANPNPLTLPAGATQGKTTLTWNAPGYSRLVIRVNGNAVTGTLGTSGSTDTGTYVTDGMIFALVDLDSGKTLATLTMKVITTPLPPPPATIKVTRSATTASLVQNAGGIDFCVSPVAQSLFRTQDNSVYVWLTIDNGQPGDVLAINWIHPSGRVDAIQEGTTVSNSGSGCYAWFLPIRSSSAAQEPGTWQVRVLTNGSVAATLPFSIQANPQITNKSTTATLLTNGIGYDYCATPAGKNAFQATDNAVWVWFTFDNGRPGDVFQVNWIHPSGTLDALQSSVTVSSSGAGCIGWYLDIKGGQPATEPGNWQVRVLANGAQAFALPFTISR